MSPFKRIFGHNQPELFPIKPLPPIFLGPPKPNGAIPAPPPIFRAVGIPPPWEIMPEVPVREIPKVPLPPIGKKSTLWGLITDCVSDVGIPNATVVLNGQSVRTDSMGRYEFIDIEPGNYVLYVYKE